MTSTTASDSGGQKGEGAVTEYAYGFKFQIGSFVKLATCQHQKGDGLQWIGGDAELRGQIISRLLEECPGGLQRHYSIRWTRSSGGFLSEMHRHNEIELVESEPFPERERTRWEKVK